MPDSPVSLTARFRLNAIALLLATFAGVAVSRAETVNVAVAANFTNAASEIDALFEQETGHTVVFSFGSTGQLYTQISQAAPFDVFLAADQKRPMKAVDEGLAVPDSRFTYCGKRQKKMINSAWRKARARAELLQVRVHDLKHTFGRRLRAAGVSFEDRQDLLGHKSGRITSHYSAAELRSLIDAANHVVGQGSRKSPALVMLKKKAANALAVTA